MIRAACRRISRGLQWVVFALAIFPATTAHADVYTVTGPQDFYFTVSESSTLTIRTYAQQYGIDSMLWLYDSSNTLITENDDYFGLDSYISVQVLPGTYRLRTGVCCGNPNAWYGSSYTIDTNFVATNETTTTTSTSTTTTSTTSTTSTTTTSTTTTSTIPETTTTIPETTTTTEPEVTTTTWAPTTTSTPPETTSTTTAPTTSVPVTEAPTTTSTSLAPTTTSSSSTTSTTTTTTTSVAATSTTEAPLTTESATTEPVLTTDPPTTESSIEDEPTIPAPPNDAPEDEKRQFEEEINIYSGEYENYVPAGSTITVAQRRVVVAASASLFLTPTATASRRHK